MELQTTLQKDLSPDGFELLKLQRWKYAGDPDWHALPVTPEGDTVLKQALELTSQRAVGRPGTMLVLQDKWAQVLVSKLHLHSQAVGKPVSPSMVRECISQLLNSDRKFSTTAPTPIKHPSTENGGVS
jgi:hypothetical protein